MSQNQIQLFKSHDGNISLEVSLSHDTVWLTQAQIAELFSVSPQNITMHLKKIYAEQELTEDSTCKDFLQVQFEGEREVSRTRKHYNLDAIISVGYRINSGRATQFRIWATQTHPPSSLLPCRRGSGRRLTRQFRSRSIVQ